MAESSHNHSECLREGLTSRCQKDLDGGVLEEVAPREDGPDLGEVPLSMQVITVAQDLEGKNTSITSPIVLG